VIQSPAHNLTEMLSNVSDDPWKKNRDIWPKGASAKAPKLRGQGRSSQDAPNPKNFRGSGGFLGLLMIYSRLGSCEFGGSSSSEVRSTRFDLHIKQLCKGWNSGSCPGIVGWWFGKVDLRQKLVAGGPVKSVGKTIEVPFSRASYISRTVRRP